jgi:hypothetical protein
MNQSGGQMRISLLLTLAAVSAISFSACNQGSFIESASSAINQAKLCEVGVWQHDEVAKECKPGQKIVFLPSSWGNDQLPVVFAAVNCDLRYNVVSTNGGVTCIYGPITPAGNHSRPINKP